MGVSEGRKEKNILSQKHMMEKMNAFYDDDDYVNHEHLLLLQLKLTFPKI